MALKKENIIRARSDLEAVFKKGKTRKGDFLSVRKNKNNLHHSRFAIIISTKTIKKATQRNRLKRLITEFIRLNHNMNEDSDFLVIINKRSENKDYIEDLSKLLK